VGYKGSIIYGEVNLNEDTKRTRDFILNIKLSKSYVLSFGEDLTQPSESSHCGPYVFYYIEKFITMKEWNNQDALGYRAKMLTKLKNICQAF
jgi:hypothetical protein